MIVSLAELLILGIIVDWAFRKLTILGLIGMLLLGVAFGPFVLDWVDPGLLSASSDLRLIAPIVILLRAGFELSANTLNRVGMRVLLLSVVPAVTKGAAIAVLGPPLLGLTYLQSAILGLVLVAVSPAVVVPLMIRFISQDKGTEKGIPTMVLAAAAIDDVLVIVVGLLVGLLVGLALYRLFRHFNPRATKRVLLVLGLSVLLVRIEHLAADCVPFAALLAIMSIGFIILEKDEPMAHEISAKLGKIWVFAEIVLFTMVGAEVNVAVAVEAGLVGAAIIGAGLVARSAGTWLCLVGSDLNRGERLFVVIAYLPKATVQAVIGGGALIAMRSAGIDTGPGEIILAVAVLSILLTAPLGAWATALAGERWLAVAPPKAGRSTTEGGDRRAGRQPPPFLKVMSKRLTAALTSSSG